MGAFAFWAGHVAEDVTMEDSSVDSVNDFGIDTRRLALWQTYYAKTGHHLRGLLHSGQGFSAAW
jgi:hypothetical protein